MELFRQLDDRQTNRQTNKQTDLQSYSLSRYREGQIDATKSYVLQYSITLLKYFDWHVFDTILKQIQCCCNLHHEPNNCVKLIQYCELE